MIHPHTELGRVREEIGIGVLATRPLPKGTIVWVRDELDQRLGPDRVRELGPRYREVLERYGYLDASGSRVICWDLARCINHSCDPNTVSCGWEFDLAVRDIEAGEEITTDYALLNLEESFLCHCRTPDCRGRVLPEDFERLVDAWDAQVRAAFPFIQSVPQPLWSWVPHRRRVLAAGRDPGRVPSSRLHRWQPPVSEGLAVAQRRR